MQLFKLLFINDMDLEMSEAKDFYKDSGNEKRAEIFSEIIGIEPEYAKVISFSTGSDFFPDHGRRAGKRRRTGAALRAL